MLRGKTALITGSSLGIGRAVADAYALNHCRVAYTSERPACAVPPGCVYIPADLTRPGEPERLVAEAAAALGHIDILVNNVGTFREPEFLKLVKADFDFVFGINVWAAVAVTREVVARAAGRGGRVLFTTSLNATRSEPGHTLYDASKGAVNALTRQLAVELAPLGFTTAAVAPGLVETPLTDFGLQSDPAARRQIEAQIPVRRIAKVEDVAGWFVFLATDAARYATGTIITVDGGLDAQQMPARPIAAAERH